MAAKNADWTAGIIAIIAALLIGSGIPTAVYFGLYKPKQADRQRAERDLEALRVDEQRVMAEQQQVNKLKKEMNDMADLLEDLEVAFAPREEGTPDLKDARERITSLATEHKLHLQPRRVTQSGATMVWSEGNEVRFEHGLTASLMMIEAEATYHDFGRFLAALESDPLMVLVPESLLCHGDNNGGRLHSFELRVYVVMKRDIAQVGK